MKKNLLTCLVFVAFTTPAFTTPAFAHEGHGVPGHGHTLQHYLLEPAHLPFTVLASVALIVGGYFVARFISKRRTAVDSTQGTVLK